MAPGTYTCTGTALDVTNTVSTTSPYHHRRRAQPLRNPSECTYTVYSISGSFDRTSIYKEEQKKIETKRKAKKMADIKSKEGIKKDFCSILKPQIKKVPLFFNHKINSDRGC